MVRLEELQEWQIVRESRMVSWLHFFKEFNHLVDLTFVPKVYKGVQMGFRGIDESLFPITAPRLMGEVLEEAQGPTIIYTDGSKTDGLIVFGIFLDDNHTVLYCLETVVFSLLNGPPFILPAI
jgi:hypothetical protein